MPYLYPVHADGNTKLTESLVVVEYLDAKYGGDKPLLPKDPVQLAQVCSWHGQQFSVPR